MKNKRRARIIFISFALFFLLSTLIIKFFYLQIIEGKKWEETARRQHFFSVQDPFLRGTFLSNTEIRKAHPEKPQKFVQEIQKFNLFIDPLSIPEKNREIITNFLKEQIDLTPEEEKRLREQFDKESRSRKLAAWLNPEVKESVLLWWNAYSKKNKIPRNALYFVAQYRRSYPFGKLLGQVLHTVQAERDEMTKQAYPTGGLELYFDSFLKGKQGKRLLKRSPRHAFETGQVLASPEDGADIYLTINHYIQAIAEEELEKGVKKCNAKEGWAVMMNPFTGEVLALAQYPFFFPSQYNLYFNDPNLIEISKVKALTDAEEPGSVVKPLTALAALIANQELREKGLSQVFDPDAKMPCSDTAFPGRRRPLTDVGNHKFMNMNMAMQKSANIYFARIVERIINRLGKEWFRNILEERFGFGVKTNLELPSESPGLLPRPGKLHPSGAPEWSLPTPFSMAMGYNFQLNAIQIARAWSLLANRGTLVKPTLVRKIVKKNVDGSASVLLDNTLPERAASFKKTVDSQLVERVVTALRYTTKPGGSCRRGDIFGYTEVGKTGTAHKLEGGKYSQQKYFSSFVGFTPVEKPAFVLYIAMNEPEKKTIPGVGNNYMGSVAAAPVFKAIATRTLEYLGVASDDPFGYSPEDPRFDPQLAKWVPETRKLQELYDAWNK